MYNHKTVSVKTKKYKKIIEILYQQYSNNKVDIPLKWIKETYSKMPSSVQLGTADFKVNKKQMIIDYISGMTDRYILKIYNKK